MGRRRNGAGKDRRRFDFATALGRRLGFGLGTGIAPVWILGVTFPLGNASVRFLTTPAGGDKLGDEPSSK